MIIANTPCPNCKSVRLVHLTSSGYPVFKDKPKTRTSARERIASFFRYFRRFSPTSKETKAIIAKLKKNEVLLHGPIESELYQDRQRFDSKGVEIPQLPEILELDTGCLVGGPEWRCRNCGHKWGKVK